MMFLDSENTYTFSNATLSIIDNTVVDMDTVQLERQISDFNMLIPTVQDIGSTNVVEYYWPGDTAKYLARHGDPNAVKYGFGPDFIVDTLNKPDSKVGIYTVNLRGPSANIANVLVYMKYKVEEGVPYLDENGNQYYKTEDGQLTLDPVDGGEIIRDVLHVKVGSTYIQELKSWRQMMITQDSLYSEVEDDDGYKTIPWFGIMYRGASSWANNTYMNFVPRVAEHDGNTYFTINLFDGIKMTSTEPLYSFERNSGEKYGLSYYIEDNFNGKFPTMRYLSSGDFDKIADLFKKYGYTVDDYLDDKMDNPSLSFSAMNPFAPNSFGIVTDEGSLNSQLTNAIQLQGGDDGTESRDELFKMFFHGEIIPDIIDPLRYRIPYIPDIGYDRDTQQAIIWLCKKRLRTTNTTLMLGGYDTLNSAIIDHQANFIEDMPYMRQLAKYQSPMMFNPWTRRNMIYPCTYFDVMAMLDHFIQYGNYFQPFAGAECRWTGFMEDTMFYPPLDPQYMQGLQRARINTVMRDAKSGCYLSDQLMNTRLWSDQTELNNAFIISEMIYDLLDLVHYNHFKFNEADNVRRFNNSVDELINAKYAKHSASLSCTVTRLGTTGRARFTNKLTVRIDLKDINRYTNIEIILEDN